MIRAVAWLCRIGCGDVSRGFHVGQRQTPVVCGEDTFEIAKTTNVTRMLAITLDQWESHTVVLPFACASCSCGMPRRHVSVSRGRLASSIAAGLLSLPRSWLIFCKLTLKAMSLTTEHPGPPGLMESLSWSNCPCYDRLNKWLIAGQRHSKNPDRILTPWMIALEDPKSMSEISLAVILNKTQCEIYHRGFDWTTKV
jgi:hypothetical protein